MAARPAPPDDASDDLWVMERSLRRRGFVAIAGADEAGRGACAGPLVAAACVLPSGRRGRVPGLADSKLLTAATREEVYAEVVDRAIAWSVVTIPVRELDAWGMHVTNIEALRRAVRGLVPAPDYVLSDGFPVSGLCQPSLAVWKGDRVAACVAAASVLAKVSRDRMMLDLHGRFPQYGFAEHKGYITDAHSAALDEHGPCPEHRMRFVNVARARDAHADRMLPVPTPPGMDDDVPGADLATPDRPARARPAPARPAPARPAPDVPALMSPAPMEHAR